MKTPLCPIRPFPAAIGKLSCIKNSTLKASHRAKHALQSLQNILRHYQTFTMVMYTFTCLEVNTLLLTTEFLLIFTAIHDTFRDIHSLSKFCKCETRYFAYSPNISPVMHAYSEASCPYKDHFLVIPYIVHNYLRT